MMKSSYSCRMVDSPNPRAPSLSLPLTALAITAIWGFNFVVIKVGTQGVPPLLLAALRFVVVALPVVFFVRAPRARWTWVAAYGLLLGVGEFGLLFTAIKLGAPAGLSSLILQAQAFMTALLASLFLRERFSVRSALGILIASAGLAIIGWQGNRPGAWGGHFVLALAMLLMAAAMWAGANVVAKRIGAVGALNLIAWSSLASPLPLLALSFTFEGPALIWSTLVHWTWVSTGAVLYLALLSTHIGYGAWNHLIVKHGAARVAPFSMLVPIFGLSAGALALGEEFRASHALAALLVLLGVAVHAFDWRRLYSNTVSQLTQR